MDVNHAAFSSNKCRLSRLDMYVFLSLSNQPFTLQQQNNIVHDAMNILLTRIHDQIWSSRFLIRIINPGKSFNFTSPRSCINTLAVRFLLPISLITAGREIQRIQGA